MIKIDEEYPEIRKLLEEYPKAAKKLKEWLLPSLLQMAGMMEGGVIDTADDTKELLIEDAIQQIAAVQILEQGAHLLYNFFDTNKIYIGMQVDGGFFISYIWGLLDSGEVTFKTRNEAEKSAFKIAFKYMEESL